MPVELAEPQGPVKKAKANEKKVEEAEPVENVKSDSDEEERAPPQEHVENLIKTPETVLCEKCGKRMHPRELKHRPHEVRSTPSATDSELPHEPRTPRASVSPTAERLESIKRASVQYFRVWFRYQE